MTWLRNGIVQPDTGFTVGDVNYPAGWIANNSQVERNKLNITIAAAPKPHDERFSWGWKEDGTEIWKDLAELKTFWGDKQTLTSQALLGQSDWMVIRKQEAGTAIPTAWSDYRTAIRLACNNRQTEINATSTAEELKAILTGPRTVTQNKKDSDGKDIEHTDPFGKSYDPIQYEQEEVGNPANLDGKYPWPDAPTS